jgi:glycerol-3-phosphate O-acyltransferase
VDEAIDTIDRTATVIFVMNHRSNMDYVLVTWLAAERSAISYAVGEWARIWPLSALIRATGAYFIRRTASSPLYRRVLARYVQMATADGGTQAIFPEGGLSLDGRVGKAKLGLLGYIVAGFQADAARDVVFVPVGLAYDRVIEDRMLVEAGQTGVRRFRARPLSVLGFILRTTWRKLRGRFPGFGSAAVAFGSPLSLRAFLSTQPFAPAGLQTEALAARLMLDVGRVVPVLPVPLVAAALSHGPVDRAGLLQRVERSVATLTAAGATLELPGSMIETLDEGLGVLIARGMAEERDGVVSVIPTKLALHAFYAAPVLQLLERTMAETLVISKSVKT